MGATSVQVIFLHRFLALLVGIVLVALFVVSWRERIRSPRLPLYAGAALALYGLQVIVGAANIWTEVADEVSISHLAFGTLLWAVLAVMNIQIHRLYERLPGSVRTTPSTDLAGVTR
jgi:heme A synthase